MLFAPKCIALLLYSAVYTDRLTQQDTEHLLLQERRQDVAGLEQMTSNLAIVKKPFVHLLVQEQRQDVGGQGAGSAAPSLQY